MRLSPAPLCFYARSMPGSLGDRPPELPGGRAEIGPARPPLYPAGRDKFPDEGTTGGEARASVQPALPGRRHRGDLAYILQIRDAEEVSIMPIRKGFAIWEGSLREGKGTVKLESGLFEGP